jgi:Fibronectin type III-like domain
VSTPLYRDPNASVEERVENLLALMTLDEKLAQLSCLWSTAFVSTGTFDPNTVAEKMPHGIGQVTRIGASAGYTTFAYRDLTIQATSTAEPVGISIEVCNSGERAGSEVVQLYCRDEVASVARPSHMLLGFARLFLTPGQARRVTFTVHLSRLAFYDPSMRFVTEPGAFTFSVGASSVDIRAEKTVTLDGQVAEYR